MTILALATEAGIEFATAASVDNPDAIPSGPMPARSTDSVYNSLISLISDLTKTFSEL
jgi:hypothetical protein